MITRDTVWYIFLGKEELRCDKLFPNEGKSNNEFYGEIFYCDKNMSSDVLM